MAAMVLAQDPAVLANMEEYSSGVLLALYVLVSAAFLWRLASRLFRHRRQLRAGHSQSSQTTVEAQTTTSPVALPGVWLPQARAALLPWTSASADRRRAGTSRERSDG